MRIFLSHTVSGQAWQKGSENADALNVESGEGIPAWTFKVEGRLLEVCVSVVMPFSSMVLMESPNLERP